MAVKISDDMDGFIEIRLCVRGMVTDNHSANVNAFSALKIISFKIKLLYKAPTKEKQNILILWDCPSYENVRNMYLVK